LIEVGRRNLQTARANAGDLLMSARPWPQTLPAPNRLAGERQAAGAAHGGAQQEPFASAWPY
jgi:hypothetical protein